jgi:hypothetical protein
LRQFGVQKLRSIRGEPPDQIDEIDARAVTALGVCSNDDTRLS